MKRLLLMRHADAGPYGPGDDLARPLVDRGRSQARLVGAHLRTIGVMPDLVLCSPAARTRETLALASIVDAGKTEVRDEPRIYGASAGVLLDVVQEVDEAIGTLMLVGHNPGAHTFAAKLAGVGERRGALDAGFPNAAVADLRLDARWSDAAPGVAELVAFVRPDDLA